MTPNEITTVLAAKFDKPLDFPFKLMLMEHVRALRAKFIKQTLDASPKDRKFFRQTVYMTLTKELEVPCELPVMLCNVATTGTMPKPLRANGILFDYVGAINGTNPFKETDPGMIGYTTMGKYSKNLTQFSWLNFGIVVYDNRLPMLRVDYIPDDPLELEGFMCNPGGAECDVWDSAYPLTSEIWELILRYIHETVQPKLVEELSVPLDDKADIIK
jgi:hypothetical protein